MCDSRVRIIKLLKKFLLSSWTATMAAGLEEISERTSPSSVTFKAGSEARTDFRARAVAAGSDARTSTTSRAALPVFFAT